MFLDLAASLRFPLPSCCSLSLDYGCCSCQDLGRRRSPGGRRGNHCRVHCNSEGSAQQPGLISEKKLRNDPSLTVITESKQVTFASPSPFAPSREQVCNETSLHASTRVCPAAKRL